MSEEKKEITLGQAKGFRFILRVVFFVIAFVVPIVITGVKLKFFTQYSNAKLSILGLLVALVIAWRFKKRLSEWVKSWEDANIIKWILIAIGRVWPFILIVAILGIVHWSGSKIIGDVLFCLEWACCCEVVAYLLIYPLEMKYDYIVKRMIRRDERKADYKEAIKEMKEEEGE